jgi:DNA helicase-2/ATP-dependent DNA helicase PcrA
MGVKDARAALRSGAPLVTVEAPAGCGKTHEALQCAIDLAADTQEWQEVLLLAHTNAAVAEFRRRARAAGSRVNATTIDAFARGLVAPYASALGLPVPLLPGNGPGEVPFEQLAPKALELLSRAPSIARALRSRYPVILLDEHQDARQDQHDLAMELGRCTAGRVRIFGDPMQAIYDFKGASLIDWETVAGAADINTALDEPHRWTEATALGKWILRARAALQAGGRLPADEAPPSVRVLRLPALPDMPNPRSTRVPQALIKILHRRLRELDGSVAVLTRNSAHGRGLLSAARGALVINEGVEFGLAPNALASAEAAKGDPHQLANLVINLLSETCRGFDANVRNQLSKSLLCDRVDRGRRSVIAPLLDALEPLYATPDLDTWSAAIRRIARNSPDWMKIDLRSDLRILGSLRVHKDESPREALDLAIRRAHRTAIAPTRCVSTIHKAKGQEFDHVIIAHCSATPFPNTLEARRLLYVALSRARKSITILASGSAPSPLLP